MMHFAIRFDENHIWRQHSENKSIWNHNIAVRVKQSDVLDCLLCHLMNNKFFIYVFFLHLKAVPSNVQSAIKCIKFENIFLDETFFSMKHFLSLRKLQNICGFSYDMRFKKQRKAIGRFFKPLMKVTLLWVSDFKWKNFMNLDECSGMNNEWSWKVTLNKHYFNILHFKISS